MQALRPARSAPQSLPSQVHPTIAMHFNPSHAHPNTVAQTGPKFPLAGLEAFVGAQEAAVGLTPLLRPPQPQKAKTISARAAPAPATRHGSMRRARTWTKYRTVVA
jgi:hypothetical protein